mgnify:CR=1 FL=1
MTTTPRMTPTTTLLIQQQSQITRVRNTQAQIRKHRAAINKTAKILQSLLDQSQVETTVGCYTDAYYSRCEVMMYADISGAWIDSLRHPALINMFTLIEDKIGPVEETTDHTWRENPTRSYTLTVPLPDPTTDTRDTTDTTCSIKIKITVTVASDSATCRKVQTGVKTESVPIYEIQCA